MEKILTLVIFDNYSASSALSIIDSAGNLFGTDWNAAFELKKTSASIYSSSLTVIDTAHSIESNHGLSQDEYGNIFVSFGDNPYQDMYPADFSGAVDEIAKTSSGYASAVRLVTVGHEDRNNVPYSRLIIDSAGNLFGTTLSGNVFEIAKVGSNYSSSLSPLVGGYGVGYGSLVADGAGNLIGTTGGDLGTVWEIAKTESGYASTRATLFAFDGAHGSYPQNLILDASGNIYGLTSGGGLNDEGTVFEIRKTSTGYENVPIILFNFDFIHGSNPINLLLDDAGNLFASTELGGVYGHGTVIEIRKTASGYAHTAVTLVSLDDSTGYDPLGSLVKDAAGNLFGTTASGGLNNDGTLYEIPQSAIAQAEFVKNDFNGDGKSDIVSQNLNGELELWISSATDYVGQDFGKLGQGWYAQECADFSGDGKADILWRNNDGSTNVWTSTGSNFQSQNFGIVDSAWTVVGAADYNGDGMADILWSNTRGEVDVWTSTGPSFVGHDLGFVYSDWQIQNVGAGDFNGDGKADILWRDSNGDVDVWYSTTSGFSSQDFSGFSPQDFGVVYIGWEIAAVGDFNGDGKSDIVWRSTSTLDVNVWTSTGSNFTSRDYGVVDWTWHIKQSADTNGDGLSDIVWSGFNGEVNVWTSTGSDFSGQDYGVLGGNWYIMGK